MKDKIAIYLCGLILIGGTIYNAINKQELKDNLKFANGEIIEFEHVGRLDYYVNYRFYVDHKKYIGSVSTSFFKSSNNIKGCVGERYKVAYSPNDPDINEIDMKKYNKYKTSVNSLFKE